MAAGLRTPSRAAREAAQADPLRLGRRPRRERPRVPRADRARPQVSAAGGRQASGRYAPRAEEGAGTAPWPRCPPSATPPAVSSEPHQGAGSPSPPGLLEVGKVSDLAVCVQLAKQRAISITAVRRAWAISSQELRGQFPERPSAAFSREGSRSASSRFLGWHEGFPQIFCCLHCRIL